MTSLHQQIEQLHAQTANATKHLHAMHSDHATASAAASTTAQAAANNQTAFNKQMFASDDNRFAAISSPSPVFTPAASDNKYHVDAIRLLLAGVKSKLRNDMSALSNSVTSANRSSHTAIIQSITQLIDDSENRLRSEVNVAMGDLNVHSHTERKTITNDIAIIRHDTQQMRQTYGERWRDVEKRLRLIEDSIYNLQKRVADTNNLTLATSLNPIDPIAEISAKAVQNELSLSVNQTQRDMANIKRECIDRVNQLQSELIALKKVVEITKNEPKRSTADDHLSSVQQRELNDAIELAMRDIRGIMQTIQKHGEVQYETIQSQLQSYRLEHQKTGFSDQTAAEARQQQWQRDCEAKYEYRLTEIHKHLTAHMQAEISKAIETFKESQQTIQITSSLPANVDIIEETKTTDNNNNDDDEWDDISSTNNKIDKTPVIKNDILPLEISLNILQQTLSTQKIEWNEREQTLLKRIEILEKENNNNKFNSSIKQYDNNIKEYINDLLQNKQDEWRTESENKYTTIRQEIISASSLSSVSRPSNTNDHAEQLDELRHRIMTVEEKVREAAHDDDNNNNNNNNNEFSEQVDQIKTQLQFHIQSAEKSLLETKSNIIQIIESKLSNEIKSVINNNNNTLQNTENILCNDILVQTKRIDKIDQRLQELSYSSLSSLRSQADVAVKPLPLPTQSASVNDAAVAKPSVDVTPVAAVRPPTKIISSAEQSSLNLLTKGAVMTKYYATAQPQRKQFFYDPVDIRRSSPTSSKSTSIGAIYWCDTDTRSRTAMNSISLALATHVYRGRKESTADLIEMSLSLSLATNDRSVEIRAATDAQRDEWLAAIQCLLDANAVKYTVVDTQTKSETEKSAAEEERKLAEKLEAEKRAEERIAELKRMAKAREEDDRKQRALAEEDQQKRVLQEAAAAAAKARLQYQAEAESAAKAKAAAAKKAQEEEEERLRAVAAQAAAVKAQSSTTSLATSPADNSKHTTSNDSDDDDNDDDDDIEIDFGDDSEPTKPTVAPVVSKATESKPAKADINDEEDDWDKPAAPPSKPVETVKPLSTLAKSNTAIDDDDDDWDNLDNDTSSTANKESTSTTSSALAGYRLPIQSKPTSSLALNSTFVPTKLADPIAEVDDEDIEEEIDDVADESDGEVQVQQDDADDKPPPPLSEFVSPTRISSLSTMANAATLGRANSSIESSSLTASHNKPSTTMPTSLSALNASPLHRVSSSEIVEAARSMTTPPISPSLTSAQQAAIADGPPPPLLSQVNKSNQITNTQTQNNNNNNQTKPASIQTTTTSSSSSSYSVTSPTTIPSTSTSSASVTTNKPLSTLASAKAEAKTFDAEMDELSLDLEVGDDDHLFDFDD